MGGPRLAALLAAALLAALAAAACSDGGGDPEVRVIVGGTVLPSPTATAASAATPFPTPSPLPFTPASPPSTLDPQDLAGFLFPLQGACLPDSDRLMPNAPREYRNGVHEGIDWYDLSGCARVAEGTPVLAMLGGVVARADLGYEDLTPAVLADLEQRTEACKCSDPDVLNRYRGRQVWIDHGNGVVSLYAHLGAIAEGVFTGAEVTRGQVIAFVGESGTPESVTDPGTEMHLHAEVQTGGAFVGEGLPAGEVRALYEALFGPAP